MHCGGFLLMRGRSTGQRGNWNAGPPRTDTPLQSAATARLFERQMQETSALRALLCGDQYRQLPELYEAQVLASGEGRK